MVAAAVAATAAPAVPAAMDAAGRGDAQSWRLEWRAAERRRRETAEVVAAEVGLRHAGLRHGGRGELEASGRRTGTAVPTKFSC